MSSCRWHGAWTLDINDYMVGAHWKKQRNLALYNFSNSRTRRTGTWLSLDFFRVFILLTVYHEGKESQQEEKEGDDRLDNDNEIGFHKTCPSSKTFSPNASCKYYSQSKSKKKDGLDCRGIGQAVIFRNGCALPDPILAAAWWSHPPVRPNVSLGRLNSNYTCFSPHGLL